MEFIPANPYLKYNPTTLTDIRKIWNLEDGRMNQSLDIIQEWILKQHHFTNKNFSRNFLEKTIVACKGSVEKAKSQIDKLCTLRTLLPKYFGGDVMKNIRDITKIAWIIPMPKMTEDHYRVFFIKINQFTAAQFMIYYQLSIVICEYENAHEYTNGFIVVQDFRDINLMEVLTQINIVEFQQFMTILIDGYGARIRGIHLLTQSKAIDLFIKTAKPMLSAKIADRIHVHQEIEELHTVVDKTILPVEYGGEERSVDTLKDEWFALLSSEEHEKYMREAQATCTDESLRPSNKYNEQIIGLPGSFRTLTVD